MISLDQVHILEKKVESAVTKIIELKNENAALKNRINLLEKDNAELGSKVSVFEKEQNRVEEGILSVLNRLDEVEDTVSTSVLTTNNSSEINDDTAKTEVAEMDIRIPEENAAAENTDTVSEDSDTDNAADGSFSPKPGENGQFDIF
ncbi:MAG: cell division protein ZapB [Treponemataceae bacterium]|nr:cell division protein ZapB [Treponemataceae bacterium]